jgi:acyl-coenzyme A synthetase/AMP-(fatty) acid ligase
VLQPTPLADMLELLTSAASAARAGGDLIHVAGKRSSLAHLNFHLNRIDGVRGRRLLAARRRGRRRGAAGGLRRRAGADGAQVIQALRERLEAGLRAAPRGAAGRLPREATGKITAATLRALARSMLARRRPIRTSSGDLTGA